MNNYPLQQLQTLHQLFNSIPFQRTRLILFTILLSLCGGFYPQATFMLLSLVQNYDIGRRWSRLADRFCQQDKLKTGRQPQHLIFIIPPFAARFHCLGFFAETPRLENHATPLASSISSFEKQLAPRGQIQNLAISHKVHLRNKIWDSALPKSNIRQFLIE